MTENERDLFIIVMKQNQAIAILTDILTDLTEDDPLPILATLSESTDLAKAAMDRFQAEEMLAEFTGSSEGSLN